MTRPYSRGSGDVTGLWIKRHGNVRTVMEVLRLEGRYRDVLLRVVDTGGSTGYRKGQEIMVSRSFLRRYYEPHSSPLR